MPLLALAPSSLHAQSDAGLGVRRSFGCFVLRVQRVATHEEKTNKGGGSVERYLAVGRKTKAGCQRKRRKTFAYNVIAL